MVLAHKQFDAIDEAGNLMTNVQVTVQIEGGGLASLYSDRAGSTGIGNPVTFADGKVDFYCAGGAHKITLTAGTYSRELRYQQIGLLAEQDSLAASDVGVPFTAASASGPASLDFAEDTDNGANKTTLQANSSLSADNTVTLPAATGTLAIGPTTTVDNTVPRFDGVTGALQTSGVAIDDSGNMSGVGTLNGYTPREVLAANRTYYVRTDGSDSNSGLANTSGGAFLTVQKAVDVAAALDLSIYAVTIQVADGTYTTPIVAKPYVGAGPINIVGNTGTPANVLFSTTAASAFTCSSGYYTLDGIKVQTTTSGWGVLANGNGIVQVNRVAFGACGTGHMASTNSSTINVHNSYSITGGGTYHMFATNGGQIIADAVLTATASGTPAITTILNAIAASIININNITWSGSITGTKYSATLNAVINTGGASLPGTGGSVATGGQFA